MNRNIIITIVALIAIGVLGFILYRYYPLRNASVTNTPVAGSSVSIQNYTFNPNTLDVKVGDTVTWTNNDGVPHHVKSDVLDSGLMDSDGTYSFKFTKTGTYSYNCSIHTYMTGQIIVK